MKNAYLYPVTSRDKTKLLNPYLSDFVGSLKNTIRFVNFESPSAKGAFDILQYINTIDVIFFNWIENLPDKKMGRIQTIFLFLLIPYLKAKGIKIVWTMHNKVSNAKTNIRQKRKIFALMLRKADLILTHSSEGIRYAKELFPSIDSDKLFFTHHPIKNRLPEEEPTEKDIDILLWGSIYPYKGVDKFLELIHEKSLQTKYKIAIAGKIMNDELHHKIDNLKTDKTELYDYFVSNDELRQLIIRSKIILFSYTSEGVLSSGALIDSLSYGAKILGPDKAAFRDLNEEGIVSTYNNWDNMFDQINLLTTNKKEIDLKSVTSFITSNSWEEFGKRFFDTLSKTF